jgi:hypothetical protein
VCSYEKEKAALDHPSQHATDNPAPSAAAAEAAAVVVPNLNIW